VNTPRQELAVILPYLSGEDISDSAQVAESSLDNIVQAYYLFSDAVDSILIEHGLGDTSAYDLWPDMPYVWLCEAMGHGVGFSDKVGSQYLWLARKLSALPKPYVETYLGDDGLLYVCGME
jgi:hypothetical protein